MNEKELAFKMFVLNKEIAEYSASDFADERYEDELNRRRSDLLKQYYGLFGNNIVPLTRK